MSLFVKICGLTRPEDVQGVAKLLPDAMGFVFWPGSKRCVKPEAVAAWTEKLPSGILKVGVFVDASQDDLWHIFRTARLDIAQLHGRESPGYCLRAPGVVWKGLNLETGLPAPAADYRADAFLVDGYSPSAPGGTGVTADWTRAAEFTASCGRLVLLAGGLTPANLRASVNAVHPWGVDVSSGVESEPGVKDLAKVKDFINESRKL